MAADYVRPQESLLIFARNGYQEQFYRAVFQPCRTFQSRKFLVQSSAEIRDCATTFKTQHKNGYKTSTRLERAIISTGENGIQGAQKQVSFFYYCLENHLCNQYLLILIFKGLKEPFKITFRLHYKSPGTAIKWTIVEGDLLVTTELPSFPILRYSKFLTLLER